MLVWQAGCPGTNTRATHPENPFPAAVLGPVLLSRVLLPLLIVVVVLWIPRIADSTDSGSLREIRLLYDEDGSQEATGGRTTTIAAAT